MTTLKAPRIPLSATSPKLPFSKPLVLPSNESNQLSYYGKSQAADLIFDNEADSGAPSSKGDSGKSPTQSPIFKDNYVDPRLATFDRNVETMRNNLKAEIAEANANAGTKAKVTSVFLKPTEQKKSKICCSLLMAVRRVLLPAIIGIIQKRIKLNRSPNRSQPLPPRRPNIQKRLKLWPQCLTILVLMVGIASLQGSNSRNCKERD